MAETSTEPSIADLRTALADFITAYDTSLVYDEGLEAAKEAAGRLIPGSDLTAENVLDRTELVGLKAEGGEAVLTAKPPHELVVAIGAALARSIGDAPNYQETSISMDCGAFTLTVQRRAGRTPHELRRAAEQQLAETRRHLEATVAQLGDLDAWTSSERDRVLDAAREHLARTGVTA